MPRFLVPNHFVNIGAVWGKDMILLLLNRTYTCRLIKMLNYIFDTAKLYAIQLVFTPNKATIHSVEADL